jgi:hypothetical protein
MLDLKNLAAEIATDDTPVEMVVTDRNGNPYGTAEDPVVFLIVGEYSKQYRATERKITERILSDARRGVQPTAEDAERLAAEKIAAGIAGWRGPVAAPFSFENAVAIVREAHWIAEKVARIIKGHSGFFVSGSAG